MKKIFLPALFVMQSIFVLSAQQNDSPLSTGNHVPDSIVEITIVLPGTTMPQKVTVEVTDGWAIMEDDIILGRIEALQNVAHDRGHVIVGSQFRWPLGYIPYSIDGPFTPEYEALIQASIDYINSSTNLWLYPSNTAFTRISFIATTGNACSSFVGMQGGVQSVKLIDGGCGFREIIHEIAHAAGLYHEQNRIDRSFYVQINWANVEPGREHYFDQYLLEGIPIGPYDFASDMHCRPDAHSVNGLPTVVAIGGETFGNAPEYSDGDIAAINWLYPASLCTASYDLWATVPAVERPLVFEAILSVSSSATILNGNNITYDGGSFVQLKPGFKASSGSVFRAVVEGCGGNYQMAVTPKMEEWALEAEKQRQAQANAGPSTSQPGNNGPEAEIEVAPNPFTTNTTISYSLPADQEADLQIFNTLGKLVEHPIRQELQNVGTHTYNFEAGNMPTGVYFLVLQTGGQKLTKQLVLIR